MRTAKQISYKDDAEWHALRKQHISGSEVAAALGVSPFLSPYMLWAQKTGRADPPDLDHLDYILFGKLLEAPIAEAVAIRTGWKIEVVNHYLSFLPELPLGGTLDRLIKDDERGDGVLEIKTTSFGEFEDKWTDGEPPLHYLLQVMSYMALTGAQWGVIACLIGGRKLEIREVERRESTIEMIETEVNEFWRRVQDNNPPPVDFERDHKVISELYASVVEGRVIDLAGNPRVSELAWAYKAAHEAETQAKKLKDASRAELLTLLGDAEVGLADGFRIKASPIAAIPDRVITPAEVGTVVKGRSGYRRLNIAERS